MSLDIFLFLVINTIKKYLKSFKNFYNKEGQNFLPKEIHHSQLILASSYLKENHNFR